MSVDISGNIEVFLEILANEEPDLIDDNLHEFYGETEGGREGSCMMEITHIAKTALEKLHAETARADAAEVRVKELELLIPKGWHIKYDPPPIPLRECDYQFYHDDYDGTDGGNGLCGTGRSVIDCLRQIVEIEENV